jgi:chemotaxis protein methyltransferase CheR
VTGNDFDFIRKLLKQRSGLTLSAEKQYLVESRLMPVAQRNRIPNLFELASRLRAGTDEALIAEVVEAMTTNETFFFRDRLPFDHFRSFILPALMRSRERHKRIRIWCAAAATGQEPYSLAMAMKEMGPALDGFRVEILATDLSHDVLEKAKAGLYSQFEVQRGLPIQLLVKYFTQRGEMWQIAPEIRAMVQYRPFNLLSDFSRLGLFDLIFCRNVLIYFDQPTKSDVLDRLARVIASDGFLILGAAETTIGLTQGFKSVPDKRGLYAPADPVADRSCAFPPPVLHRDPFVTCRIMACAGAAPPAARRARSA